MFEQSDQEVLREQILNHPAVVKMDDHERRDVERDTSKMTLRALENMLLKLNDEPTR